MNNDSSFNPFYYLSMDELVLYPFYNDIDINSIINANNNDSLSSTTLADTDSDYIPESDDSYSSDSSYSP